MTIREPEEPGTPFRVSGEFFDRAGKLCLAIDDNELKVASDNWDAEVVGSRLIVRRAPGDIVLRLIAAGRRGLQFEHLDMLYQGVRVRGDRDWVRIGAGDMAVLAFRGTIFEPDCCIDVRQRAELAR